MKKYFAFNLKKINLQSINKFALFLLIIIITIDPSNKIFHLKDILFFLFIVTGLSYIRTNNYSIIFFYFFYALFRVSILIINYNDHFNQSVWMQYFKSFLFLSFFLWCCNKDFYNIILRAMIISTFIISIIIIVIYIIGINIPEFPLLFLTFDTKRSFIFVSYRNFIGIEFLSVYYKTSTLILLTYSYSIYKLLISKNKIFFYLSIVYVLAIFFSGTRANMVMIIFIFVLNYIFYLMYNKKKYNYSFFLVILFMFIFFILLFFLLQDNQEISNKTKTGHIISLVQDFFSRNIFSLFYGVAPGKEYFSTGINNWTAYSEITYLELLRMFGFIDGFILLLVFLFPSILLFFQMKYNTIKIPFFVGFFSYFLVGGTNPLFIGSTGFIMLLFSYIVISQKSIENE